MVAPAIAAAGAQAAGSIFDKGIDFGFGVASGQMYEKQVRELRRTAYQDMMHSMREAGLNPLLAAGASPGNSAGYMIRTGSGTGLAAYQQAQASTSQAETAEATGKSQRKAYSATAAKDAAAEWNLIEQTETQRSQQALNAKLAQRADAEMNLLQNSAKEASERTRAIQYENVGREAASEIMEGNEGTILKRIEAWSKAIQGLSAGSGVR